MKGVILVLGAQNDAKGKLSPMGEARITRAIELFGQHPGYKIMLTGTYGWNFNRTKKPHAEYMKQFLLRHGVPERSVLPLIKSTNTLEDLVLAKRMLEKHRCKNIVLITSGFHMPRVKALYRPIFGDTYRTRFIKTPDQTNILLKLLYLTYELISIIKIQLFGLQLPTSPKKRLAKRLR